MTLSKAQRNLEFLDQLIDLARDAHHNLEILKAGMLEEAGLLEEETDSNE